VPRRRRAPAENGEATGGTCDRSNVVGAFSKGAISVPQRIELQFLNAPRESRQQKWNTAHPMDLFSQEVNGGTKNFFLYFWPVRGGR
jgi:hypothetical protein